jgi:hypothetical protein
LQTTPGSTLQNEKTEPPLKLDQTFERKEYGFRFNYPSSLFLDNDKEDASFNNVNAAEMMRLGTVYLYFSQEQDIMKAAVLRVDYMAEANLANEQVLRKKIKQKNGTLKLLEKATLDGQNCIHIKVTFGGGLMDTTGKRISEQYVLLIKQDCALIINYSALTDQFEKYRLQFTAILQSFRIEK